MSGGLNYSAQWAVRHAPAQATVEEEEEGREQ